MSWARVYASGSFSSPSPVLLPLSIWRNMRRKLMWFAAFVFVLIETCFRYTLIETRRNLIKIIIREIARVGRRSSSENKELTRYGDCKICHHVTISPLLRLKKTFEEVQGVRECWKKKNVPDTTGKLEKTHMYGRVKKKDEEFGGIWRTWTFDCGNVSFLFFVFISLP